MKIKTVQVICFLLVIIFTTQTTILSQTQPSPVYRANLLGKKGTGAERKDVLISQENSILKIDSAKDRKISRTFSSASIRNISYSYSEQPQIKEAIGIALLTGGSWLAAAFLFNKDKRHWLVITTDTENIFLELPRESYRQLLFELSTGGFKVEDLGNRNSKENPLPRPKPAADFIEGESCDVPISAIF